MPRLIDADALIKHFATIQKQEDAIGLDFVAIIDEIKEQPTAYDVDKVVEQLEEERELSYADFDRYVDEVSSCLDAEYDDFFHRGLERALKIVKGGGIYAGIN